MNKITLVLSGNMREYDDCIRNYNLKNAKYIADDHGVRGYKSDQAEVLYYGTYYHRKDLGKIIKVIAANNLKMKVDY